MVREFDSQTCDYSFDNQIGNLVRLASDKQINSTQLRELQRGETYYTIPLQVSVTPVLPAATSRSSATECLLSRRETYSHETEKHDLRDDGKENDIFRTFLKSCCLFLSFFFHHSTSLSFSHLFFYVFHALVQGNGRGTALINHIEPRTYSF